ncbi:MAG: leucine--tRNA ligase [Firmicutes bacterium]|nr:leucine--tRNA ligase [Bacillota bacterium]
MPDYDFRGIEARWSRSWEEQGLYRTVVREDRPKFYALTMLPYPSGDLHIGHWYAMTPSDARARFLRMRGYNVLFPMGFDAFGLPAENAAIKRGVHPRVWTYRNIERMRAQLRSMGAMFDWSREVVTCEPEYYRWNQWFFLRMYERGLAYRKMAPVDWCPSCNTTLAREQVVGEDRRCERCDTPVVRRDLEQWFFRITAYADELLDFSKIEWPEPVVTMQRNWIGRSEGVEFEWQVAGRPELRFRTFTTRIDTLFGASFCVLAPEHPLVDAIVTPDRREEVERYRYKSSRESEIERLSTEHVRDGAFTGAYALHPFTDEKVPVWIADYVLLSYGTGAIMGVPAHDERDFDFARRYGLPIPVVIAPPDWDGQPLREAYTGPGRMVHSGEFTGLPNDEGWRRLAEAVEARGIGRRTVHYRMRDWLISRQRYWGTPIPIVYCERCGTVPVPDEQLPVLLPEEAEFLPTGESPLKRDEAFLHTACPRCGGPATRETDTMDTFVDSSWYWFRYLSPHERERPWDPKEAAYWLPVDQYTGGAEHAVMHLLYARFFTKVLRDLGLVDFDEPFLRLKNQGVVLGEDSQKMSKSRGNVVAPDELVERYGADVVRVYLMFMAPWEQGGPWSSKGIEGAHRFLNRVWRVALAALGEAPEGPAAGEAEEAGERVTEAELLRAMHRAVQRVTADMERFDFNTAVAALMELTNLLMRAAQQGLARSDAYRRAVERLLLCLAPMAPFVTEELWHRLGHAGSIHLERWPEVDPAALVEEQVLVVVQVNGRVRERISVPRGLPEEELARRALESVRDRPYVAGKPVRRLITVPDKLVNVVVG